MNRKLLEKVLALPRRIEPIGGQNYSYVCLEDVTGIIESELEKPEPDPVAYLFAWIDDDGDEVNKLGFSVPKEGFDAIPLYTSPPARKPLSDEEIVVICIESLGWTVVENLAFKFARAIEKAHGIGDL
jgi:hypothetical protein